MKKIMKHNEKQADPFIRIEHMSVSMSINVDDGYTFSHVNMSTCLFL